MTSSSHPRCRTPQSRAAITRSSPLPRYRVADDSWAIFGVVMVVAFVLGGVYCVWKAFPTRMEMPPANVAVVPSSLPPSPAARRPPTFPTTYQPGNWSAESASPTAGQPLSWQELTLMLRTGLQDDEIIAAAAGRPLASPIGPAQSATLRELGAGNRLLNYLRTRPVRAAASEAPRVIVTAPALPGNSALPSPVRPVQSAPTPPPVDYAARDRQIKSLQAQIDAIDEQIRQVRSHPDSLPLLGTYNGRGYSQGDESPLKKYLDQLDKQRNDLRRQKWQLEGR